MLIRRFDNPRNIIRAGYTGISIALIFNFIGRRLLSGLLSPDAIDAVAGLLHGIAFGLLGLGIWRLSRSAASRADRSSC
jgi:hypothetical protein